MLRGAALAGLLSASPALGQAPRSAQNLDPGAWRKVGEVDPRFQSYNIEMVEVTGGRFWKPYRLGPPKDAADRYSYRPPVDLANPRLRKLAAALGPAYVRVSGTWANTTAYVPDAQPPPGFSGVLTGAQWRGVVDFARATDAALVTSFAASPGVRDAAGAWTPAQLKLILAATHAAGGRIAGAEFINEPNLVSLTGAPEGYTAADYGRDFRTFRAALKAAEPGALILGPGSAGEGSPSLAALAQAGHMRLLSSDDMLAAAGPPDVVSFHHYGALSQRCVPTGNPVGATRERALTPEWLDRPAGSLVFYAGVRARHAPGAPLWLSETADAACGGNPWASTFADSFRYLDQLGQMARGGVKVVMHNTLAASDYGLLDEDDFHPRPNYWAALLWRRLMGTGVLDPGPGPEGVRLYAQCLRGTPGGVAVLAMNLDSAAPRSLSFPGRGLAYVLASAGDEAAVALNGRTLVLGPGDALPALAGAPVAGSLTLPPRTIAFLALPAIHYPGCR